MFPHKRILVVLLAFASLGLGSCAGPHVQKALSPTFIPREGKALRFSYATGTKKAPVYAEEADTNGDGVFDRFTFRSAPSAKPVRP